MRLSLSLLCVAAVILFFSNSLRVSDFRFYSSLCVSMNRFEQRFWNNQQDLISQVVILIFCSLFFPVIFRSFSIWMHRFSPLFFRCAVFLRAWRFIRGSELIILCSFFFCSFLSWKSVCASSFVFVCYHLKFIIGQNAFFGVASPDRPFVAKLGVRRQHSTHLCAINEHF